MQLRKESLKKNLGLYGIRTLDLCDTGAVLLPIELTIYAHLICISSCLGKLFCSILNQRLLKHIQSRDILHKSQIGFLANNRTADHVLTLRTLIDKYVNCHKTKVYACFVDFRKAFDSVWHDGLLYKLLQINVRGNFYKVIKSLYSNSTCSIRIGNNQTQPFQYTRGVRQGCILSPLLFNLYVNDPAFSFNTILSDLFVLPNGTKLNSHGTKLNSTM